MSWTIYQVNNYTAPTDPFNRPFATEHDAQCSIGSYWIELISSQFKRFLSTYTDIVQEDPSDTDPYTAIREVFFNETPEGIDRDEWIKTQEDILGELAICGCDEFEDLIYDVGDAPNLMEVIRDHTNTNRPDLIVYEDRDNLPVLVAVANGYRVSMTEHETYYIMEVE